MVLIQPHRLTVNSGVQALTGPCTLNVIAEDEARETLKMILPGRHQLKQQITIEKFEVEMGGTTHIRMSPSTTESILKCCLVSIHVTISPNLSC